MLLRLRWRNPTCLRRPIQFVLTAGVLAVAVPASAQDATELPPVVVEGATLEAPRAVKKTTTPSSQPVQGGTTGTDLVGTGKAAESQATEGVPIEQVGAAVSVVTRQDLENRQIRYAADALRSLPGVEVSTTGGVGNLTQVRIRGAEANQTLVLIDGIEANNPTDGEFDFSNLATADIERIEVIRGPMSGVYGSSAVGGVINIITRGGRGPLTFTARTEAGSFDTSGSSFGVSAGNDKGYLVVNYDRRKTDGFNVSPFGDEDDGSHLGTFSARAGLTVLDDLSVNFVVRNMTKRADRDGFGGPDGTLATAIDDRSWLTSDTWLAGVNVKWDTLDGHLTHELRANRNATITTDTDLGPFPGFSRNQSADVKYGYLSTLRFDTPIGFAASHSVSALVEHETENFTPGGDFGDFIERTRKRDSIAGEYQGGFARTVFVTANLRYDNNDTFENFTTWRTAVSVPLQGIGLRPHASAGTSVKFPNLFEQFGSFPAFFTPNPNLVPEESFGWDAGAEYTFGGGLAILDVTYFDANLKNEIVTLGFPFSLQNAKGESTRKGIEVAARAKVTSNVSVGAAYTWLDAKDDVGQEAVRRPPHTGRVDVNYAFAQGRGNLNLATVYNGRQQDLAFRMPFFAQERVDLDAYWFASVAASYQLTPGIELFGRVENAFDSNYQESYGFETAGVAVFAGVRLSYVEQATVAWANNTSGANGK